MKQQLFLGSIFFLISSISFGSVFGDDNRRDVTPGSAYSELGRSTAVALITSNQEIQADGRLRLLADPINKLLCPGERFLDQRSLAYACSGFLIAPDLLLTAGHCQVNVGEVRNEPEMYCKAFDWLFDYQPNERGEVQMKDISMDRLYHCKRTIYAVNEERFPFRDFAIVQLDRPVMGRKPFKLASQAVTLSEAVAMIGYPMGLPMKSADHAKVIFNKPEAMAFVTNLDAFEGNSGSAVFNSRNEVVGIVTGGTPVMGTIEDKVNKCERVNHCDDEGRNCLLPDSDSRKLPASFQATGTDVQRIGPVLDFLRAEKIPGF